MIESYKRKGLKLKSKRHKAEHSEEGTYAKYTGDVGQLSNNNRQ